MDRNCRDNKSASCVKSDYQHSTLHTLDLTVFSLSAMHWWQCTVVLQQCTFQHQQCKYWWRYTSLPSAIYFPPLAMCWWWCTSLNQHCTGGDVLLSIGNELLFISNVLVALYLSPLAMNWWRCRVDTWCSSAIILLYQHHSNQDLILLVTSHNTYRSHL